jgi:hypothetical protein
MHKCSSLKKDPKKEKSLFYFFIRKGYLKIDTEIYGFSSNRSYEKEKRNKKRKTKTYDHKYMSKLGFNPLTSKRKWSW